MSSESPTGYNAAADLIERNLIAGRGAKTAFIDDRGQYSYAELAERVSRLANLVRRLGIHPEQCILLCLHDTIDFPTAFLGAIKAGAVPVAVNTQLTAAEFAFMAADSRVGAASVLMAERPTPAAVSGVLRERRPTIIYGVPTLYNAMLAGNDLPPLDELALRRCVSAGEPLPQEIGRRWSARIGVDILDGIGSTEMLHIFLSNWPDKVRYGTTGRPIPGYQLKIVDEEERPVRRGDIGGLF